MNDLTDEQFNQEVAALEKELTEGVAALDQELQTLHSQLNLDLAAADTALQEFAAEVEKEDDIDAA